MKVAVRLAILVAALLLVTNMAFASQPCDESMCYEIVATDENGTPHTDLWFVCLYNDGTGTLHSDNAATLYQLYLFGGGLGWFNTSGDPAIGGNPQWTTWIARGTNESGSLHPIGDGYLLTGEGETNGNRYTIQGKKVPCAA
jgi:hypothetical protein